MRFRVRQIVACAVQGEALAADTPLSFWGGYNPLSGEIIDQRHPLVGEIAAGKILVIPAGRGSCSGSGVLLEAIHNGVAPLAIMTSQLDPIISLGAVLGDELYDRHPAVVIVSDENRLAIDTGDFVVIDLDGWVTVTNHAKPGA